MKTLLQVVLFSTLCIVPVTIGNANYQHIHVIHFEEYSMITQYDNLIKAAVKKHLPGYDWRLFKAQLWTESRLKPLAKSEAGAVGIGQFMPKTWTQESIISGYKGFKRTDPEASIFTAASYMSRLMKKWKWKRPMADRECLAAASYNVGFGNMLKAQKLAGGATLYADIIAELPNVPRVNHTETINYVKRTRNYCTGLILGSTR